MLRALREQAACPATTPLVRSQLGDDLWLKVEGAQPTGTFKDRVMAQLTDEAVADGCHGAIVASSGNAAVAAAAACLQRQLPLLAVVPVTIDAAKLRPLALRGTSVLRFGRDPSEAYGLAHHLANRFGLRELASTFFASGAEFACRQIGHEVVGQLGCAPRAVAAAISVGPVLIGTGNGVVETGAPQPVLLAAQAAGCAPIAAAFATGSDRVELWQRPVTTAAGSIADRLSGYAGEGTFALGRIRASGGSVAAFTDQQLRALRDQLARTDGVDAELASAAALGVAREWDGEGPVVVVLTGAGWRDTLTGDDSATIEPTSGVVMFERAIGISGLMSAVDDWPGTAR